MGGSGDVRQVIQAVRVVELGHGGIIPSNVSHTSRHKPSGRMCHPPFHVSTPREFAELVARTTGFVVRVFSCFERRTADRKDGGPRYPLQGKVIGNGNLVFASLLSGQPQVAAGLASDLVAHGAEQPGKLHT